MIALQPLADRVGRAFARRDPSGWDDYLGAARLGAVQAVDWLCAGRAAENDNTEAYVVVTCRRFCSELASSLKGSPKAELADTAVSLNDPGSVVVVEDILSYFTEREREIITLRMSGYSMVEIGAKLTISQGRVSQILDTIRCKYNGIVL